MSAIYDQYLDEHKSNVAKGFKWLVERVPSIFEDEDGVMDEDLKSRAEYLCVNSHDFSKSDPYEYHAYDEYFYGNKSYETVKNFEKAWLHHVHMNPHHWQHWILHNDDPEEGMKLIEMPTEYIIEMICDWWSFSWKTGNLYEIFNWYNEHREYMLINPKSVEKIENILSLIKHELDNDNNLYKDNIINN